MNAAEGGAKTKQNQQKGAENGLFYVISFIFFFPLNAGRAHTNENKLA